MEKGLKEKLLESGREEEESLRKKLWSESKKLWIVAGPAIFTRFSTFGVTVISQAFIGHIGATELAAFALVQTVLLRFANGILRQMGVGMPAFNALAVSKGDKPDFTSESFENHWADDAPWMAKHL